MPDKVLIIGAAGQIGSELLIALRERHGIESVLASDINDSNKAVVESGPFVVIDATNRDALRNCIVENGIQTVYMMAALLSAKAEQMPQRAWDLNMETLFNVLELAKEKVISKLFWPSSIAVFGPTSPSEMTPQNTITEPTTVYGISKLAGERWCEYYASKYDVDVRSLRYPGIIGWRTKPGGGTTDYAVEIFHEAIEKGSYECFLRQDTRLPMMFMDDALRATIELMEAAAEQITVRSSYNLSGVSFSPVDLEFSIREILPEFKVEYKPDYRQKIADSWPESIDDSAAKQDWGWKFQYDLRQITAEMLQKLQKKQLS